MPRSLKRDRTQQSSAEAMASARYSDSVEDQETIACFLADQVMALWPK